MVVHLHYECVCVCVCVEITFHTFLTSALAGSKYEVTSVTNRHTQTIPQCTTEENYQPHASTTSKPQTYSLIHTKEY